MKLIEAKQAKEFANSFFGDPILKMAVNSAIDNCPRFDLVRCKDCKRWERDAQNPSYGHCEERYMKECDFCSYGERRTDG